MMLSDAIVLQRTDSMLIDAECPKYVTEAGAQILCFHVPDCLSNCRLKVLDPSNIYVRAKPLHQCMLCAGPRTGALCAGIMAPSLYAALGGKRSPPKAALVTCGLNPPLAVFVVRSPASSCHSC